MDMAMMKIIMNNGILCVIGVIFLKYVTKMLDQTLKNQVSFQKKALEDLKDLKNTLVNGYLNDESLLDIAKSKYSHSLFKYRNRILKYFIRNNICENKKSIKIELDDFICGEANEVGIFFKTKTTNLYADTIKKITLEQLKQSNEVVFGVIDNINTEHNDYKNIVRELEGEFKKIHTNGLEYIEEMLE